MRRNTEDPTEKPLSEMPRRCSECPFLEKHDMSKFRLYGTPFKPAYSATCTANGARTPQEEWTNPGDTPLPMSLNCYWWYANKVWSKVSPEKKEEYRQERKELIKKWEKINAERRK